jgi:hypothetical protein
LEIFVEQVSEIILRDEADQFLQHIAVRIQKIKLGLIDKPQRALEGFGVGVVGIEVTEFDPAKIFRFKPMNHGRHGAAGTSGKAKKFHQLQLPGRKIDRCRVGGFERIAAGGGKRLNCRSLGLNSRNLG